MKTSEIVIIPIVVAVVCIAFIATLGYNVYNANENYYKGIDTCMQQGGEVIPGYGNAFTCIKRG